MSRQDDDDADIEEAPPLVVVSKMTKKRRRPGAVLSFGVDSEDADPPTKRGLGFGGVFPTHMEDDGEGVQSSKTLYDAATLEALKSSQKYKKLEMPPPVEEKSFEDESFIPLNGSHASQPDILAGDDAEAYLVEERGVKPTLASNSIADDDDPDVSSNWEAQIMKRVGLTPQETKRTKSLDDLRGQISDTLSQLKETDDDLQQAYNRRRVEVTFAEEEVQKYQSALHDAGEALEYYQEIRHSLTDYVGALRDLQQRLQPLQDALRQTALRDERWKDWECDAVSVIKKAGYLIEVVGRQPPAEVEAEIVVDEFGRNMKAQHVMARERRFQQRFKIIEARKYMDGYESDALQSPAEVEELKERRKALREALQVALEELDDNYSSLPQLISIFEEWHKKQPEDYASCHAGMSLADLASVLLQVDLCSTHHPLHWSQIGGGFPFVPLLQAMSIGENIEETPLYRTVDKVMIPVFVDVLNQEAYNVHSSKQSMSMATYFQELSRLIPPDNILLSTLTNAIVDYLHKALHDIAIPIVSKAVTNDAMVTEAMSYATTIQVARIQKIISNICAFWVPTLGDRLAESLVDFCANQFLTLVGSLEAPKAEFAKVWPQLSRWLDRPQFMVQASLLRAAASTYHLD